MGHVIVSGGAAATKPLSGILAATLAVGSSVYLMEDGSAVEYLVVNQGIPSASSLYDASCDGLWLLRKDICADKPRNSSASNVYASSTIHTYLNVDFLNFLGSVEQSAIRQVKIPYVNQTGNSAPVLSGENGLETKIFLLSGYEVGFTSSDYSYFKEDGACLSYFEGTTAANRRTAKLNGTAINWWLRSMTGRSSQKGFVCTQYGDYATAVCSVSYGIRPALILPSTALFDKDTLILKGVA
jgi:hypothetical protein